MGLMDMGLAILCLLARHRRPPIRFLFIGLASLLRASFGLRLAASVVSPLRFANPSSPSGWVEDFHLPAIEHAGHAKKTVRPDSGLTVSKAAGLNSCCNLIGMVGPTGSVLGLDGSISSPRSGRVRFLPGRELGHRESLRRESFCRTEWRSRLDPG
jgi:hypothetical protein